MSETTDTLEESGQLPSVVEFEEDPPARPAPKTFLPELPPVPIAGRLRRRRRRNVVWRFAYRLANRVEHRRFRRGLPFDLDRKPELAIVRKSGRLRIVNYDETITGHAAAELNRAVVLDVCESAGISYFAVPEPHARRARIGIAEEDWPRLVSGLLEAGTRTALYLGVAASSGGRVRRWPELSNNPDIQRAACEQRQLEVFRIVAPPRGGIVFDRPWACVVERWDRGDDKELIAPTKNLRAGRVGADLQTPAVVPLRRRRVQTLEAFTDRHIFDVDFPIDVVYMWVDGADPQWRARKDAALEKLGRTPDQTAATTSDEERFRDNGELRYSLRSLHEHAPWVNHIYLVTDAQVPDWLDLTAPKLTLVDHRDIFGGTGCLPSFNSHAIGGRLHHISGLSEHYIHFNDDFFLGRDVTPELFFQSNGVSKFFLSRSTLGLTHEHTSLKHEDARRNVVRLLQQDFGRAPSRAFFHAPITQRRTTMFELERRYSEELSATWSSQFRSSSDYEINSWLHHYYGYITGRAVPANIRYDYFDLSNDAARRRMSKLLSARDKDAICINDGADTTLEQWCAAVDWLEAYFPRKSPYER